MRILIVSSNLHGGGLERAVSNISLYLPQDIEVDLLLNSVSDDDFPHRGNVISLGMKPDAKMNIWYQAVVFWKRLKILKKLKRNGNYQVCLSFMDSANFANIITGKKYCKTMISIRNYNSLKRTPEYRYIVTPLMRILYNKADQVVAISKGVEDDLIKNFGVNPDIIETIYNIYNVEQLGEMSKQQPENFVREEGKFYFLASGRHVRAKAHNHLIRAFKPVVEKYPNARLVILGNGEWTEYYNELIKELELEKYIALPGFLKNPFAVAGQCDVFVFPSLYEGFGNVLLENMSCGLPIIASDFRAGAREVLAPDTDYKFEQKEGIEKGQNGILVPVCSGTKYQGREPLEKQEKILSEAMCMLIEDTKLREHYCQRSLIRAKDFSKDAIINEWVRILKK